MSGARVTCQASNVMEFLVSRNIVPRAWAETLDSLDKRKDEMLQLECIDGNAREFLQANKHMDYDACVHLSELLQKGEDGKAKRFLFVRFKSPVVLGWISVVAAYEDRNLFLAERARELKRVLKEFAAHRKAINERGLTIASVEEKLIVNDADVAVWQQQLAEIKSKYSIEKDESTIRPRITAHFRNQLQGTQKRIDEFIETSDLQLPRESDSRGLRLQLEEEFYFQKTQDPDAEVVAGLRQALTDVVAVESTEVEAETDRVVAELDHLTSRVSTNRERTRLTEIIGKCRAEIADMQATVGELSSQQADIVARIRCDLSQVAPYVDLIA